MRFTEQSVGVMEAISVPDEVLDAYGLNGASIEALSGGRTNRTLRVRAGRDLVLQQLLGAAHGDLLAVMENLVRVTGHLDWRRSVEGGGPSWYPLLMPTNNNKPFLMTADGDVWRAFSYRTGQILRSSQPHATLASAAAIYGRFCAATADLGGPPLIETAPGFHDIERVASGFFADLEQSPADRRADIEGVLDLIQRVAADVDRRCADDGLDEVPLRVVHNDTKLSNVLFDRDQGDAVAVLDLDLVMMGPAWHDFGDLMRSACWHAPNAQSPCIDGDLFETIVGSYVDGAQDTLSDAEISTFATAGARLSLELGMRYLHDHLRELPHLQVEGHRGHLRRGLANVKLAEEMLSAYDALRLIADECITAR